MLLEILLVQLVSDLEQTTRQSDDMAGNALYANLREILHRV